jgi:hypothetical protein
MKFAKKSGKKIVKMSKDEWLSIGKKAGWLKVSNSALLANPQNVDEFARLIPEAKNTINTLRNEIYQGNTKATATDGGARLNWLTSRFRLTFPLCYTENNAQNMAYSLSEAIDVYLKSQDDSQIKVMFDGGNGYDGLFSILDDMASNVQQEFEEFQQTTGSSTP